MDYKAVSQQVVDNVGGLENIEGATHCVTRLRLVLKDTSKYNKAELENIDGVKGVLYNSGQLMIIFGTGTVNKVYDEFMALTGVKEISASEVKGAEADKKGKFFSVLKVFSDIFIPIIPAFVGAAIIIGLKSLIVANGLFGMEAASPITASSSRTSQASLPLSPPRSTTCLSWLCTARSSVLAVTRSWASSSVSSWFTRAL